MIVANTLHIEYSYDTTRTISTSWSVGGFLTINIGDLAGPAAAAGFDASFTETTATGDTVGTTSQCGDTTGSNGLPGNWVSVAYDSLYRYRDEHSLVVLCL